MKALGCAGLRRATPVTGTQQGANATSSALSGVHARDLPGGLEARLPERLDLQAWPVQLWLLSSGSYNTMPQPGWL